MRKDKFSVKRIFILYLPILAFMVFILFPFYWTFITSIKVEPEIYLRPPTYWPRTFTLQSYINLFVAYPNFDYLQFMKNSGVVTAITTITSLVVCTLAAYSFSRFRYKGRRFLMCMFLVNNMFPAVLLLIPLYTIMRSLQLLYTPWALVLSYTTFTIPFSVWMLTGFLNDLPLSLEEAAMIDGCNRPKAFQHIVLPILTPSLLATGVYIFMVSWNEYTFASLFTNPATRTIPVALRLLVGDIGVKWDLMTAGGVLTILPVCIMFFFAQRRLVTGLTAGAVKG